MSQFDYIKEIAKYGLENDQSKLHGVLTDLIDYSIKTKKTNFALQLQSILKESLRNNHTNTLKTIQEKIVLKEDREANDFILEKLTSDYRFHNLVCSKYVREDLDYFIKEHKQIDILQRFEIPVSNKIMFYGPTGCGKTLASYVLAGELSKMMIVINLGGIVSSKLGETSRNLANVFKRAANEECIIFLDEFDSLGKLRDYNQDHAEMKRVVNTILQLFDYLPQTTVVIAATNQIKMIDSALIRRFDLILKMDIPNEMQIKELINVTLKNKYFYFDKPNMVNNIIKDCKGLSFYTIQKTLLLAIKYSIFEESNKNTLPLKAKIKTTAWKKLIKKEKSIETNRL